MKITGRTGSVLRNAKTGLIKTIITYVLQFVVRTILIYTLGAEYVGLGGLFTNILGCLSLAELGFGTAIVVSMYKPVADGDIETVKSLNKLYVKIYSIISFVILVVGLSIMPFLRYLIKGGVPNNLNIYVVYILLLINTVISYFAANKRSLLFVYQRNDIENNIVSFCTILMTLLQIVILLIFKNYYMYMMILPLMTLLQTLLIILFANKKLPFIKEKAKPLNEETKNEVKGYVKALSWHQLGGVLVLCTDNIIISAMLGGLRELGIYSNYTMITVNLLAIITMLISAFQASVGNMLAVKEKKECYIKFLQLNIIFNFLIAFCTVCVFVLIQPFMMVWLRRPDYLLSMPNVILICLSFFFGNFVITPNMFNVALGTVKHSTWKPFCQGIINLVVSILLALKIGLAGVIIGTIISYLTMPVWVEPFILFKYYFKHGKLQYLKQQLISIVSTMVSAVVTYFVCGLVPSGGIGWLVLRFAVCALVAGATLLIGFMFMPEFKECIKWGKQIVNGVLHRRDKKTVAMAENVASGLAENVAVNEAVMGDNVAQSVAVEMAMAEEILEAKQTEQTEEKEDKTKTTKVDFKAGDTVVEKNENALNTDADNSQVDNKVSDDNAEAIKDIDLEQQKDKVEASKSDNSEKDIVKTTDDETNDNA